MTTISVLEVIRQGQIGGGESHLLDLIAGFESDVRPVVLAFTPGQMIDTLVEQGITCYVIETSHPFDLRILKQIETIIKKERIELIHAHGSRAASNVTLTARKLHIPLIYTVHGWSFHQDQSGLMKFLRGMSEKLICSQSKQVICVSESNRITGIETFGLKNAVTIENGINLQKFNPRRKWKDVRKEFGFAPDDFIIGFICRVTLQKSPLDYIKSLAIAHEKEPKIKGLMVGEGDMKEECIAYIHDHKLEEFIVTSDFRTDVPDLLHAVDVFCLPSLWEGLSIALLEAMAMSKALVVTPTDGTKELIRDKQNGMIADFNSPEQLATMYLYYFSQPKLKELYGEAAMRLIEQRFDSRRVSKQVTGIYKKQL